jgi:hypothetical protein
MLRVRRIRAGNYSSPQRKRGRLGAAKSAYNRYAVLEAKKEIPAYKIQARSKCNADKSVHKREDKYPVGDESQHLSGCSGYVADSGPRRPGSGAEQVPFKGSLQGHETDTPEGGPPPPQ